MCDLIFEYGMPTVSWYAELAFRTRVSMSAIGSVIDMAALAFLAAVSALAPGGAADLRRVDSYQLDLVMPGSSPLCAIERKQIRQRPNFRYTARGRPQRGHRVYPRTSNFGFRLALTIRAVFAICQP